jgi:hypothetical protein
MPGSSMPSDGFGEDNTNQRSAITIGENNNFEGDAVEHLIAVRAPAIDCGTAML